MARFVWRMIDGSEWTTDPAATRSLSDEVAFERYFGKSSAVVSITGARAQEFMAQAEVAVAAGQSAPTPPDDILPRTEWLAFFAWRQLKRAHPAGVIPATFDEFIDAVEDMDYQEDDNAAEESDQPSNVVTLEASGLDPTAPAAPPTPPPVSSWPASVGNRSS